MLCWCAEHSIQRVVFGVPLQSHLQHTGAQMSVVIEQCVMALLQHGLNEEVSCLSVCLFVCLSVCLSVWPIAADVP